MLVILTEQQVLSTKQVCSNCLLADSGGVPRWRKGKLCCGHPINQQASNQDREASAIAQLDEKPLSNNKIYECEMGFRVANIK